MGEPRRAGKSHAAGNQIPSPSHSGGTGLLVRRLAGMLAGRMGQTPTLLPGDAGENPLQGALGGPDPCLTRTPGRKRLKTENAAGKTPAALRGDNLRGFRPRARRTASDRALHFYRAWLDGGSNKHRE